MLSSTKRGPATDQIDPLGVVLKVRLVPLLFAPQFSVTMAWIDAPTVAKAPL